MAYRVDYQPIKKVRGAEKRRVPVPALIAMFFLAFVLLVNTAWPRGSQVLRRLVFSGDTAVTAAALEDMARDLGEGEALPDALEAFCKTILKNGKPNSD